MRRIRTLPENDHNSGWLEALPPRPAQQRLQGDEKADCAIIGAGFCGLAIARRLTELKPDWRVVIIDAQKVGYGASGRSSGFVVDLTDAAALMDPEIRDGYVRLSRSGIDHLRTLVQKHDIDCAWDEKGWIRAYAGEKGKFYLDRLPPIYDELGYVYEPLDAEQMRATTGTGFYEAGIRLPGYPLIQSGALVRGLADHLPDGITVYEESPVTSFETGPPHRLVSPGGTLTADRLFIATNGYTPFLGYLQDRIFPLYTFGSLTRVLTEEEQAILGGENEWGILAMDPMGSSVRRTRDQRLLIRNTILHNNKLQVPAKRRREIEHNHQIAYDARFPNLPGIEFEYTWSGLMGSAKNSQLSFKELSRQVYAAAGFTAAGIAMGTAAGTVLADFALGQDTQLVKDIQALPKPTWMPPNPFRSIGGSFMAERMNRQAGETL